MKKVLAFFICLLLVGIAGLFSAFLFTKDFYWELKSNKVSPNGGHSVYKYFYSSDGSRHAPYGTYLYLQNANSLQSPLNGYLIFAGYCGQNMNYSWSSNQSIVITCEAGEPQNIRTLASKAYGIQISLKSPSSPHTAQ